MKNPKHPHALVVPLAHLNCTSTVHLKPTRVCHTQSVHTHTHTHTHLMPTITQTEPCYVTISTCNQSFLNEPRSVTHVHTMPIYVCVCACVSCALFLNPSFIRG